MVLTVFSIKEAYILLRALQGMTSYVGKLLFYVVKIRKQEYGLTLLVTTDDSVNKFLCDVLGQIEDWLTQRKVKKLVVVLNSVESKEVLERWEFKIENETIDGKLVDEAVKDEKKIKSEIRDVIRQITASVTFLPLLDCLCSFDILIYTHRYAAIVYTSIVNW